MNEDAWISETQPLEEIGSHQKSVEELSGYNYQQTAWDKLTSKLQKTDKSLAESAIPIKHEENNVIVYYNVEQPVDKTFKCQISMDLLQLDAKLEYLRIFIALLCSFIVVSLFCMLFLSAPTKTSQQRIIKSKTLSRV